MNRNYFTSTNLWIECVDFYNRGYSFKELQEVIQMGFPNIGIPEGASTSIKIDLYGNYSDEDCCFLANRIYNRLEFNCPNKR